jgi:RNase P subunit RPR2
MREWGVTKKERLWRWVLELAERKISECHDHSRKCPNCGIWSAIAGVVRYRDLDDVHAGLTCGQCGHEARWDMVSGMLPILAEPDRWAERMKSATAK